MISRVVYVKNLKVVGCVVYDDAVPVRMDCNVCGNKNHCTFEKVVFEEDE